MGLVYSLAGVEKSYGSRMVLDISQLDIERGEVFAIVGPSGAGKTTLLRILNFLEYADVGDVKYDGQTIIPDIPLALRRQVTTVFQRPALLNDTVEKNVAYGMRLRGERDGKDTVRTAMVRMGLDKLCKSSARTLSAGEAQRVALARAIVIHPKVLLLDEPTANLDPYNIGLIEDVIREINQTQQTSVVLVTHNVFQAKRLATRVGLLLNGQMVEAARTQQFFDQPEDTRTRAFVNGEMIY